MLKVTNVAVEGKKLRVTGENFSVGAIILLDSAEWETSNDAQSPTTALMSKKAGKKVKPGKSAVIQVKNADGTMSTEFVYARPAN